MSEDQKRKEIPLNERGVYLIHCVMGDFARLGRRMLESEATLLIRGTSEYQEHQAGVFARELERIEETFGEEDTVYLRDVTDALRALFETHYPNTYKNVKELEDE